MNAAINFRDNRLMRRCLNSWDGLTVLPGFVATRPAQSRGRRAPRQPHARANRLPRTACTGSTGPSTGPQRRASPDRRGRGRRAHRNGGRSARPGGPGQRPTRRRADPVGPGPFRARHRRRHQPTNPLRPVGGRRPPSRSHRAGGAHRGRRGHRGPERALTPHAMPMCEARTGGSSHGSTSTRTPKSKCRSYPPSPGAIRSTSTSTETGSQPTSPTERASPPPGHPSNSCSSWREGVGVSRIRP